MYLWRVMKLCKNQLLDINKKDILNEGLYRLCNTYKSGGGYDRFSSICKDVFNLEGDYNTQFVVQLRGCPLKCWYCYVTQDGVNGEDFVDINTKTLVMNFMKSGAKVFHLMGGAPALYIENWYEILDMLKDTDYVFHSDLLLIEKEYSKDVLYKLATYNNSLYAVSIKGILPGDFYSNTMVEFNEELFYKNFDSVVESCIKFYLTFTNIDPYRKRLFVDKIIKRYGYEIMKYSFDINLVWYNALEEVYNKKIQCPAHPSHRSQCQQNHSHRSRKDQQMNHSRSYRPQ